MPEFRGITISSVRAVILLGYLIVEVGKSFYDEFFERLYLLKLLIISSFLSGGVV